VAVLDLKRLKALHSEPPKTLIALVRIAWPEISIALNQGHSLKTVHQRLSEAQIKITYRRLSEYVCRLRREEKLFGATHKRGGTIRTSGETSPKASRIAIASTPTATSSGESDVTHPLADFRERTARAKTFEFEPGPPDESKLI
jgi:hypothetical protein